MRGARGERFVVVDSVLPTVVEPLLRRGLGRRISPSRRKEIVVEGRVGTNGTTPGERVLLVPHWDQDLTGRVIPTVLLVRRRQSPTNQCSTGCLCDSRLSRQRSQRGGTEMLVCGRTSVPNSTETEGIRTN